MRQTVTIVIVNWNSGALLRECLAHCLRQTVPADAILVVDNASQDNSLDGVDALPGVTVMPMERNLGFAAANNRAIAQCTTDWVLLLNPDAFAEPGWMAALLAAAAERPNVVAFGSRQMQHGKPGILDGIGDSYYISGQILRDRYQQPCRPEDLVAREIFSPCAAAAMYRLDAVRQCGGFDEDFFCYAEDVDLGFRLRLAGHSSWYVPDAVVWHMGSATVGGQHSDFATYYGHRNLVWVFVKNMPGPLFWPLLPIHVCMNVASFFRLSRRGQASVGWRAKRDALRGLPAMWRHRTLIQRAARVNARHVWNFLSKRIFSG
ncbi:glycosyltransferase family 2 protein [Pseudorhodoferax sp. Leaf265]|uniref:glycosyltransferase family 2 protein n=1 Tax=Pseudorhodoferax sp. Leaf265 TaxID=1736315 RepID=UPI000AEB6657|nr:glycosyltransferase family 2 protein [Pseudorhodoferax sp. Leaf265]